MQLCTIGMLIELFQYAQMRSNAVPQMQCQLPLQNYDTFTTLLDLFLGAIGNHLLTCFRLLLQLKAQMSTYQKELISRRAYDAAQRFLVSSTSDATDANKAPGFVKMVREIRDELVATYKARGDHSEANSMFANGPKQCAYLAEYTYEMMQTTSEHLLSGFKLIFDDLKPKHRHVLEIEGALRVHAAHLAVLSGRKMSDILSRRCSISDAVELTGRTVLHLAAEMGNVQYLQWVSQQTRCLIAPLLEKRDTLGLTPLMVAAYSGCLETFKLLSTIGADLHAQHRDGRSILSLASMAGHDLIVSFILSQGVQVQDCLAQCSPLHDAAATGRSGAVVKTLLEHKAEPRDERLEHGNLCASQIARHNGHEHIATILLQAEEDLERRLPTKGLDLYDQIRMMKRRADAVARSHSPESSHGQNCDIPVRKRQRSIIQQQDAIISSASSRFSTPQAVTSARTIPGSYMQDSMELLQPGLVPTADADIASSRHTFLLDSPTEGWDSLFESQVIDY